MLLYKKYGDMFEVYYAGDRKIVLSRPDLIENINSTSTKTKYPHRFEDTEGLVEYGIGAGVGNNNDLNSWRFNRQFFTQAMFSSKFEILSVECINELWKEIESYWNEVNENKEIDLVEWMHRVTHEIIFKTTTGVKPNAVAAYYYTVFAPEKLKSLNKNEQEKWKYYEGLVQSIHTYMNGVGYFFVLNKFIRENVPFIRGKVKTLLKNKENLFNRVGKIVKERRIEIENTPLDQPLRHDFLTAHITTNTPRDINIINHNEKNISRPMTDSEIIDNIVEAITAGTESAANMVCFIVYYLEHNPEAKKRLRQEFDQVFGNDLTRPITYKDLDELNYCEAVIKEVNRHRPIAFIIGRVSNESDNIGGYEWPKGSVFHMHFASIMKNKNYWTDPEKFNPDRFYKVEESEDKYLLEKKKMKNTYEMFGGGVRMCPGRKLAMLELKCLITLIYRNWDIDLADINAPLNY
ncbi:24621_t:CDS:2, partial [Cetraspora pellucida]